MVNYDNWTPDPQIKEIVDRRMVEVRQQFLDRIKVPDTIAGSPKRDHIVYNGSQDTLRTVMMRLDFELAYEDSPSEKADEAIVDILVEQLSSDFYDLLENGDADNRTDPLLGALNGKNKVGKELSDVIIGDIALYKEHVPRKKSVEYTIYTRVGPLWA
jgi:hypothetical protein